MKKLIPAMCMLLIAASLFGTSTFAWFSMNKTVTATGMQVKAKSNSIYLLISKTAASDTADKIQAEHDNKGYTEVEVTTAAAEVYPSALATVATKTGVKKTEITDYSLPASWYTSSAADASKYASVEANETALTALTDYVLSFTYRFTLADGSEDASNLHVKQITVVPETPSASATAPTVSPVSIVVVNHADQSKVATFTVGSTAAESDGSYILTEASATALAATVTDTDVVQLDVYVYYDGNNSAVFTNNTANLNGAGITIEFEVEEA